MHEVFPFRNMLYPLIIRYVAMHSQVAESNCNFAKIDNLLAFYLPFIQSYLHIFVRMTCYIIVCVLSTASKCSVPK